MKISTKILLNEEKEHEIECLAVENEKFISKVEEIEIKIRKKKGKSMG
jgi:hypothetical protein